MGLLLCALTLRSGAETMPIEAIRPGMTGEWETVVSGTEVTRYGFEVLGIHKNFLGPGRSLILIQATDDSQKGTGPVSGMSGSPCYIDGKLIGAYAYGYTWPKNQALIGVTPIADMLETFEYDSSASGKTPGGRGTRLDWRERLEGALDDHYARALLARMDSGRHLEDAAAMQALPLTLAANGLQADDLAIFESAFAMHGLKVSGAPLGNASQLGADDVQAGSALAAVLLDGDFRIAAAGTVTWREADRFLAFGHPFLGEGEVEIPVAPAEILTVAQRINTSFKLANIGPVVGGLSQDRLAAVAGSLGAIPPRTELNFNLTTPMGEVRNYAGNLFRNKSLAPMVSAIGLLSALQNTMDAGARQTYRLKATYNIDGRAPLVVERVVTGEGSAISLSLLQWFTLSAIVDNPFVDVMVDRVDFDIEVLSGWDAQTLQAVNAVTATARAGKDMEVAIRLGDYLGKTTTREISVPLPASIQGQTLSLFIGDGNSLEDILGGSGAKTVNSFDGLLRVLQKQPRNDRIHVRLLRQSEGLQVDGEAMPGLPPSVRILMDDNRGESLTGNVGWETLWQAELPVSGVFRGSHLMTIKPR